MAPMPTTSGVKLEWAIVAFVHPWINPELFEKYI
jgi:hypothetical protein